MFLPIVYLISIFAVAFEFERICVTTQDSSCCGAFCDRDDSRHEL